MNLNATIDRALYNSPLHRTGSRTALTTVQIELIVFAILSFQMYLNILFSRISIFTGGLEHVAT
jgi:hypothetical protein